MAFIRLNSKNIENRYDTAGKPERDEYHSRLNNPQSNFFSKFLNGAGFFRVELDYLTAAYDRIEQIRAGQEQPARKIRGFNTRFCKAKAKFGNTTDFYHLPILVGFWEDTRGDEVTEYNGGSAVGILECFPSNKPENNLKIPEDQESLNKELLKRTIETPEELALFVYEGIPVRFMKLDRKSELTENQEEEILKKLENLNILNFSKESKPDSLTKQYEDYKKENLINNTLAFFSEKKRSIDQEELNTSFATEGIPSLDTIFKTISNLCNQNTIQFPNNKELTNILGWNKDFNPLTPE